MLKALGKFFVINETMNAYEFFGIKQQPKLGPALGFAFYHKSSYKFTLPLKIDSVMLSIKDFFLKKSLRMGG